jgi:large conductance mechanosensitive channel
VKAEVAFPGRATRERRSTGGRVPVAVSARKRFRVPGRAITRTPEEGDFVLKGFKDFISRGNVIELAVGVVIGTVFTAIVTAFTNGIIKPFINALGGHQVAQGLGFHVLAGKDSTFVDIGGVINAAINFLLVAAVVYFIFVVPMNRLRERRDRGQIPSLPEPTDVELLTEIRDLLKQQHRHGADHPDTANAPAGSV